MIDRLIIAGGKTGGHLYPGIAVAEEVTARNPAAKVLFIGTTDGIESRILPKLGWPLETISVSRLKGGGVLERIAGTARIPLAMWQSWRLFRRHRPQVVLGVGGYASGPALIAAWLTRRPTAIQEQNATAGLTNRILGRFVRHIYLGFDAAAAGFDPRRALPTGNPIRAALVDALAKVDGVRQTDGTHLRILVFGGSQGARFLNENVPQALAAFHAAHPAVALTITHQTGTADEAATRARYAATPLSDLATVTAYIDDMPTAYAAADVAISRAGALTIAELTAVGLPSLLVPFPFAADNHQEANASVMVDAGCALMLRQPDWSDAAVTDWLWSLTSEPGRLSEHSRLARAQARPHAAKLVVDHLEGLAA